jgi:hypothetical protein
MLDIVAAIFATAYCAAQAGLMIGPAPLRAGSKIALFAATAAWLAVVVAVYGLGVLSPGTLGPFPVNLVPFTLLLAILFGASTPAVSPACSSCFYTSIGDCRRRSRLLPPSVTSLPVRSRCYSWPCSEAGLKFQSDGSASGTRSDCSTCSPPLRLLCCRFRAPHSACSRKGQARWSWGRCLGSSCPPCWFLSTCWFTS